MASIPHLKLPFTILPDGTAAVVQQDSLDDVVQCVNVLVATPVGSRVELPAYGVPDATFGRVTSAQISKAISTWEPRAVATVTVTQNAQNPRETDIQVSVSSQ